MPIVIEIVFIVGALLFSFWYFKYGVFDPMRSGTYFQYFGLPLPKPTSLESEIKRNEHPLKFRFLIIGDFILGTLFLSLALEIMIFIAQ